MTPPYTAAVAVTISIMYYYTHMNIFIQNTKYSQLIPRMSKYYWFDCEALNIYFNSGLVYSSGNIIVSCVGLLKCMHFTIWIIASSFVDTYMYINIIFISWKCDVFTVSWCAVRGQCLCLHIIILLSMQHDNDSNHHIMESNNNNKLMWKILRNVLLNCNLSNF